MIPIQPLPSLSGTNSISINGGSHSTNYTYSPSPGPYSTNYSVTTPYSTAYTIAQPVASPTITLSVPDSVSVSFSDNSEPLVFSKDMIVMLHKMLYEKVADDYLCKENPGLNELREEYRQKLSAVEIEDAKEKYEFFRALLASNPKE